MGCQERALRAFLNEPMRIEILMNVVEDLQRCRYQEQSVA